MRVERVTAIEASGNGIQLVELGRKAKYPLRTITDGKWDKTEISATPTSSPFPFDQLHKLKKSVFYISPHRVTPPSLVASESRLLTINENNSTNLHQVLLTLHNNYEALYDKIQKFVCSVFTDVERIDTLMLRTPKNHTAVNLKQKHTGLRIPLAQSGTGIEQLLTICTLVIGSEEPLVILLDEPHAFLHPKAEKKLIALFEEFPRHQYIVATHSPIWINKASWDSLHWIVKEEGESTSQPVLTEETEKLEPIFHDLGIKNSDWTSVDSMIFVEGGSDEEVYRVLLSRIGYHKSLLNTGFVPIGGTGLIQSKRNHSFTRNNFFSLCHAIIAQVSKLPIRFFFVFDGHEEGQQHLQDLRRQYGENIQILSRYEIENFLLEPAAIVEAIKEEAELYSEDSSIQAKIISNVNLEKMKEMFETGKEDENNYVNVSPDSANWEKSISGASLLKNIYKEYQLIYSKRTSGPRIANHLSPEFVDKIKKELNPIFKTILQE